MTELKSEQQMRKEAEESAKPQRDDRDVLDIAPPDLGVAKNEEKPWLSTDIDNSKKAGTADYVPPPPPKPE